MKVCLLCSVTVNVASIGSPRPNAGEGLGVRGTKLHLPR